MKISVKQFQQRAGILHVDRDGNGKLDVSEARTVFNALGVVSLVGTRDALNGTLILSESRSALTGLERDFTLQAFAKAKLINVLSTLAVSVGEVISEQSLMQSSSVKGVTWNGVRDGGSSVPLSAKAIASRSFDAIEGALGLDRFNAQKQDAFDFLVNTVNTRQLASKGGEALVALGFEIKLTILLEIVSAALDGFSPLPVSSVQDELLSGLALKVFNGLALEDALTSNIRDLLSMAAESTGVVPDTLRANMFLDGVASIISQLFARIDQDVTFLATLLNNPVLFRAELLPLLSNYEAFTEVFAGDVERAWSLYEDRQLLADYTGAALAAKLLEPGDSINHVVSKVARDVIQLTDAQDMVHILSGVFSSGSVVSDAPDTLGNHDEVIGFQIGLDSLKLPSVLLADTGVYGRFQVSNQGVVTNIVPQTVEGEVESGITAQALEEVVNTFFATEGFLGRTVVVLKDNDSYVLQSDDLVGRQESDLFIKLAGITVFDANDLFI